MGSVSVQRRVRANFELGFRREAEDFIGEGMEFVVDIFGDPMVFDMEKTPFSAGIS